MYKWYLHLNINPLPTFYQILKILEVNELGNTKAGINLKKRVSIQLLTNVYFKHLVRYSCRISKTIIHSLDLLLNLYSKIVYLRIFNNQIISWIELSTMVLNINSTKYNQHFRTILQHVLQVIFHLTLLLYLVNCLK